MGKEPGVSENTLMRNIFYWALSKSLPVDAVLFKYDHFWFKEENLTTTQQSDKMKNAVVKGMRIGSSEWLDVFVETEYKFLKESNRLVLGLCSSRYTHS